MSGPAWLAALAACLAAALLLPTGPSLAGLAGPAATSAADRSADRDWLRRWRPLWTVLAGAAAAAFLGGPLGWAAAPVAAGLTWLVIERSEPAQLRNVREQARRDLPHVVGLLADALRAGQPPQEALTVVAGALPGPAADRLAEVVPRLRLGVDPEQVWADLAADPALGPLGRALARAHRTGSPVVPAIERLATELSRSASACSRRSS